MKLPPLAVLGLSLLFSRTTLAEQVPPQLSPGAPSFGTQPVQPSVRAQPGFGSLALPDPNALPASSTIEASSSSGLAKFEPASGCYVGAFIERDYNVQGDIGIWEAFTKKKHASFFTYVGYGRPFPSEWVEKLKRSGAAPQIAFEPNDGLDKVEDGPYLRAWARDAARAHCPIFLRWASEMNGPWQWKSYFSGAAKTTGDPAKYIEKFRLVSRVMKEEAPNVAMVWTPFATPQNLMASYYPGDDWVDWVGVNIYAVFVNDGDPFRPAAQKDIVAWLRWVYDRYASRKPIHISEFAATIFCKGTSEDTVSFAIDRMRKFYGAIRTEFPRVKSVNWFCWDTIRGGKANNNYSFIDDGRSLAAYRSTVADPYFLSSVADDGSLYKTSIPAGTTLGANGITLPLSSSADELLAASGALNVRASSQGRVLGDNGSIYTAPGGVARTSGALVPVLLGVKAGEVVRGDLDLSVTLPQGVETKRIASVSWLIDGRSSWMTNTLPFAWSLHARRLTPGTHEARVQLWLKDSDEPLASAPVSFEVAD